MPRVEAVPAGASFAFETGLRTLEEQERRNAALDSKAGVVLAGAGVIAGFVFRGESLVLQAPLTVGIAVSLGLVSTMALALVAFATRWYAVAPAFRSSIRLMASSDDWLRWRFLGNMLDAADANEKKLLFKARILSVGLWVLLATIVTLGGYFVYTLATRN